MTSYDHWKTTDPTIERECSDCGLTDECECDHPEPDWERHEF